jgi:hypothetical protein
MTGASGPNARSQRNGCSSGIALLADTGEVLPPHTTTSIIGEVLAEIDKRSE